MPRRGVALLALVLVACAHAPSRRQVDFHGPGRMLLILERSDLPPELIVFDADGAHPVAIEAPREARFVTARELLVVVEVPALEEFRLPDTRLVRVDLASGRTRSLGERGRHYDAEPSPDGRFLAVGRDTPEVGDSDLEIWSLRDQGERIAVRHQSLEEPRWQRHGPDLVVGLLMADPESDDATGGGFGGTALTWPRLHRLRRDLGAPERIADGERAGRLEPGGSLPLWWDERGLFARQRRGLVRCDPDAGRCQTAFAPDDGRRVADGRRFGEDGALLLTADAEAAHDRRLPDRLLRVDLRSGSRALLYQAPAGTGIAELDWIAGPGPVD